MSSYRGTASSVMRSVPMAALLACLCVVRAHADSAPATQAEQAGSAPQDFEEIVVTARRVAERAQSVPIAVTPLNAASLEKASIFEPGDLQFRVPSLSVAGDIVGGSAQPVFAIRGLAQEFLTEPTVVMYYANVPADTRFVGNSIFDLANVQVVRGPQGTLFGKNAVGGAILFEPAKPTDEFDGSLQVRYGNYDSKEVTGVLNTPIAPGVDLRIAGNLVRQDGLIKNIDGPALNDKHRDTLRVSLLLTPNDSFQNYTLAQYYHLEQHGDAGVLSGAPTCAQFFFACAYTPVAQGGFGLGNLPAVLAQQQALGGRTVDDPYPNRDDIRDGRIANTTTVNLDGVTLKNTLGYNYSRYFTNKDVDGTSLPLFSYLEDATYKGGSDELQLQGSSFDALKWIVGAFYSKSIVDETNVTNALVGFSPTNPATGIAEDTSRSTALFAQGTYDLSPLLQGLEFTGGYRYSWDKRDEAFEKVQTDARDCALIYPPGTPQAGQFFPSVDASCTRRASESFSAGGYTYGFNYKITDAIIAYVSRNRAYKAGGLTQTALNPIFVSYQPEYAVDTEVGVKADWHLIGRPIRTNLALYRMNFSNIQLEESNLFDGIPESIVTNGSTALLKGAELEISFRPVDSLTLDINQTVAKGTYGTLIDYSSGAPVNLASGRPFANVPGNTGRYSVTWDAPTPETWGRVALSADYYRQSSMPGLVTRPNSLLNQVPAYGVANARLDVHGVARSPLDLSFYVKNIQNKLYSISAIDDSYFVAYASRNYGDPRLYGAQLTYRFGASAR